jgi:alkanesulfonate monooxygenase SsuD/methylene tetrahydromethanopterin reductase-like flavin-dependent oxidoreductase (luciferase family)
MIIGIGLDDELGLPWDQWRESARVADQAGFESVWTRGRVPDAYRICADWARDTSMITGISVVPAGRMSSPAEPAAAALELAQSSQGRFVLGIGTGGAGPAFWAEQGRPDRPIAFMREFTVALRSLLSSGAPYQPPLYLAALGPQMVRLAGELADGVLLNWASPERIATSRSLLAEGAARSGRDVRDIAVTSYIRVCIDDDVELARRAYGDQILSYALSRPGVSTSVGYRGLFAQMGFEQQLRDLEARRDGGAARTELIDSAPDELFRAVGYYGPAADAAAEYARLTVGLDHTIARVISPRPGLVPMLETIHALTPSAIRTAAAAR